MTEERRLIQETAREFARREVLPLANKLDPEQGVQPLAAVTLHLSEIIGTGRF